MPSPISTIVPEGFTVSLPIAGTPDRCPPDDAVPGTARLGIKSSEVSIVNFDQLPWVRFILDSNATGAATWRNQGILPKYNPSTALFKTFRKMRSLYLRDLQKGQVPRQKILFPLQDLL